MAPFVCTVGTRERSSLPIDGDLEDVAGADLVVARGQGIRLRRRGVRRGRGATACAAGPAGRSAAVEEPAGGEAAAAIMAARVPAPKRPAPTWTTKPSVVTSKPGRLESRRSRR